MAIIYGLFDPRKTTDLCDCRYIGLTGDPADFRLAGHIREAMSGSPRDVYEWIRTLLTDGINPTMVVLQDDVDDEELDAAERSWIVAARYVGADLTNVRKGGRKPPPSKRRVVTQAVRTIEDPIAWRNLRIKEGHTKTDKTPTMCECGAGPFVGIHGVKHHAAIKHNDQCETWCECGAGPFIGNHGLNIHRRRCGKDDELTWCVICQSGPFDGPVGIRSHWSFQHGNERGEAYCDDCDAGPFLGQHGLSGHKRQAHVERNETFCDCGAGPFDGHKGLTIHLRYCGVDEAVVCPDCGAGPFTSSTGLHTHHERSHADKPRQPLMCDCGQGPFVGPIGLSAHQRQSCTLSKQC